MLILRDPTATTIMFGGHAGSFHDGWIDFPIQGCYTDCFVNVSAPHSVYIGWEGFIGLGNSIRSLEHRSVDTIDGLVYNVGLSALADVADWLVTPGRSPADKAMNMIGSGANVQAAICLFDSGTPSACSDERSVAAGVGALATVIPGARLAGAAAERLAARARLTGQIHHDISRTIHKALEQHPNLKGPCTAHDPRFVTQAKDLASHRGYDTFHRNLDAEIAGGVRSNPNATQAQFESYLQGVYQRPDVAARFPNGL